WREEAELKRRLVRVLHREPAVVAVPHVGVDAEPELLDIECERLILISNIQTDHFDALAHRTSISSVSFVSPSSCRRFSETAIVRPGRWAARRKHSSTRSRACAVPF